MEHYPSFADRFNDVVAGLKESKSTVVSLFKSDEFPARLAWNPPKEYKRKVDNLGQNENKSGWMSARHAVAEKLGVHRNENGEFEDKDGNIIAENTSFKTELAVSRSTALKRRPGSNKAPAISKLVPPTIPPGTPQLLDPVPIGSPLPEEHVNDPGPPSLDTSKKRTKTKRKARSKISKGAEVVQHPRRAAMSSSSLPRVLEAKASSVAQASTALQTVPQRYPSQPLPSPQQVQVSQQAYMERQQHHIFQQAPMPYPYLPSQAQPQLPMTDAQYGPPRDTITQGNNKKRRLEYEPWPGLVSNTPSPWTGYTPTPDGYAYQSEFSPQQFTVQSQQYNTLAGQVPDPINDPFWVPDLGHFGPQE
ncbi:hypothetical protein RRF57_009759 [Xylaria bambusicola]|uniref:Uncharacterized protein n=1 Tax=Xylaria bambusicola TaxID=326684 RepID=A0AAN7UK61_9PEZI